VSAIALRRVVHAERAALDRMIDPYLAEIATHREHTVGPTDAASYVYLPLYWEEPGRHPFFIVSRGERVGFVLVRVVKSESVIEMSEFCIQPESRRSGLGRAALAEVWRMFPGIWRLQVHPRNEAAAAFWPRCIAEFASGPVASREVVEEDGRRVEYRFAIAPSS
jgi:predicted acetyltransferase